MQQVHVGQTPESIGMSCVGILGTLDLSMAPLESQSGQGYM